MAQQKQVAIISNPTIEAVCYQLFKFPTEAEAVERLETIKDYFIVSKEQDNETENLSVKIWIKGFMVTEGEEKLGYLGNFALMQYALTEDGKYTLYAEKLEVPLRTHPQKRYPKHKHPNWGHPVLRKIKKGHVYPTIEDAQADLQRLHEEFPQVSIPTNAKMYIIIYSKDGPEDKRPVKKFILEIQLVDGGGFTIEIKENTYRKEDNPKKSEATVEQSEEDKEAQGYFASMVDLKRAKKNKRNILDEVAEARKAEEEDGEDAPPAESSEQ